MAVFLLITAFCLALQPNTVCFDVVFSPWLMIIVCLTQNRGGYPYFHTLKQNLRNFRKSAQTLRVGML